MHMSLADVQLGVEIGVFIVGLLHLLMVTKRH